MKTKYITASQKAKWYPALLARDCPDGTPRCFYCKGNLGKKGYDFDHLNNRPEDNRFDNIVLSHHACNIKKANYPEWQVLASEKLKENVASNFLIEWERERKKHAPEYKEASDEADISTVIIKHSKQFLAHELLAQNGRHPKLDKIRMKNAVECVAYLVSNEVGRCSHAAVQRHLETLSCSISKEFDRLEINGKWYIVRRTGQ